MCFGAQTPVIMIGKLFCLQTPAVRTETFLFADPGSNACRKDLVFRLRKEALWQNGFPAAEPNADPSWSLPPDWGIH